MPKPTQGTQPARTTRTAKTGTAIRQTTHAQRRRSPHNWKHVETPPNREKEAAGHNVRPTTSLADTQAAQTAQPQTGNMRPLLRDQCCTPRPHHPPGARRGITPPVRRHRRTGGPLCPMPNEAGGGSTIFSHPNTQEQVENSIPSQQKLNWPAGIGADRSCRNPASTHPGDTPRLGATSSA